MILVDSNLLLYAYDTSSPGHRPARRWIEAAFGDDEQVGLALVTVLAFLRIGTDPAVFRHPFTGVEALRIVESWLDHPSVSLAEPTDRHWSVYAELTRSGKARGPLMMDAHLATLSLEHGATLCTTDRDFARYPPAAVRRPARRVTR